MTTGHRAASRAVAGVGGRMLRLAAVFVLLVVRLDAQDRGELRALSVGTPDETACRILDSGLPGPTVLVVGGVHGDEPAGSRAARQIAGWSPERGRLAVVERANPRALAVGERRTPGLPSGRSDLNRQFPRAAGEEAGTPQARALWQLVHDLRPDYLLDLHEGVGFTRIDADTVGSSIIADAREPTLDAARRMIAAIDATIPSADKKFMLKRGPVAGSLARAAAERLGVHSMILETTRRDQALAFRARQHRILVHALLSDLGMVAHGPDRRIGTAAGPDDVRVGMYVSRGVGGAGPRSLERLLVPEQGFVLRRLCVADIRAGELGEFDLLIFPGGSGSGQAEALAESGREVVRAFVESGGGYLGICAGAYLAANNYAWSLGILDADVIDRQHWARGRGPVPLKMSEEGRRLLGRPASPVLYANGPIYAPSGDAEIPDMVVLARFDGEVRKSGVPGGVMPGTPAVVRGRYGRGRVVAVSPHPEQSEGSEEWTRRLVRLAAGREGATLERTPAAVGGDR